MFSRRNVMKSVLGLAAGLTLLSAASTMAAADETRVVFVTHGQSGDPYWSVVKNGMDDAAKTLGVKAEYLAPETFDMAKMAQMIDAIAASKPDGLVVSIPDAAALSEPVKNAVAAGIPVIVIDSGGSKLTHELGGLLFHGADRVPGRRHGRRTHEGTGHHQGGLRQPRSRQFEPRRPLRRLCQGPRRRCAGAERRHGSDRNEEPRHRLPDRQSRHRVHSCGWRQRCRTDA